MGGAGVGWGCEDRASAQGGSSATLTLLSLTLTSALTQVLSERTRRVIKLEELMRERTRQILSLQRDLAQGSRASDRHQSSEREREAWRQAEEMRRWITTELQHLPGFEPIEGRRVRVDTFGAKDQPLVSISEWVADEEPSP